VPNPNCAAVAFFLLHESGQAGIAALHKIDEEDHRKGDALIK
jgi:hypothetical protein